MRKIFTAVVATLLTFYSLVSLSYAEVNYPNKKFLIETDQLAARLDDPNLLIIDMRGTAKDYEKGHIKNAIYISVDQIRATIDGVPGMLPPIKDIENRLGQLGIGNDTTVAIYDDKGGLNAARLFWTLDYLGHEKVAIVNGGINKWIAEGRPLSTEARTPKPREFKAKIKEGELVEADWIVKNLKNPEVVLLDVRTEAEYLGKDVRSKRGGHIPGAINIPYTNTLKADGTFKSTDELKELFEKAGVKSDKTIVPYCQTFHRGAHSFYVLRLLGYPKVKAYDGSWAEWGNKENLPVTTEPHSLVKK